MVNHGISMCWRYHTVSLKQQNDSSMKLNTLLWTFGSCFQKIKYMVMYIILLYLRFLYLPFILTVSQFIISPVTIRTVSRLWVTHLLLITAIPHWFVIQNNCMSFNHSHGLWWIRWWWMNPISRCWKKLPKLFLSKNDSLLSKEGCFYFFDPLNFKIYTKTIDWDKAYSTKIDTNTISGWDKVHTYYK